MQHLELVKVLVVDGKSVDRTVEIAKNLGAEIAYQDRTGKGDALAKGIKCMDPSIEYAIITDADYTYPIDAVPKMIHILEENSDIGMVCGNRYNGQTNTAAFHGLLSFGNKLIALTHRLFNGVNLQDPLTGLRVVRASILRNWKVQSKGFDIEVELNRYVERMGYSTVEVPIQYRPRVGQKKLKISDGAIILKRIMIEVAYPLKQDVSQHSQK
jgi:dolichol-phosphate mannosyltransferase